MEIPLWIAITEMILISKGHKMNLKHIKRKGSGRTLRARCAAFLMAAFLLTAVYVPKAVSLEAAVPSVSMGILQTEPYYDTLRSAFFLAGYDEAGACNGWVETVIHKSGLVGDFIVGGTVLELNNAMAKSDKFTLTASYEGGSSDYQTVSDQMIRDVSAGKIKAGDIVIYTRNMTNPSASGPHWLHAAIVMKEIFDGTVENYAGTGRTRWKSGYIGYPTIGHALAPAWGVEYRTPMTTPSTYDGDDGSTGYYVYRINTRDEVVDPSSEGWVKANGNWYYYENREPVTGWKKDKKKWYYMNPEGVMQTGWKIIGGKWYFFSPGGAMRTGWKLVKGKWYFLGSNGAMQTGWKRLGGKWYFLNPSGVMHTGWKTLKGCTYYMGSDGAMLTGTAVIGGVTYEFDENGVLKA